jgi:hypothetical protein
VVLLPARLSRMARVRGARRLLGIGLVLGCLLVPLSGAVARMGHAASRWSSAALFAAPRSVVPMGSFLVADLSGRVFVLSKSGRVLRRVPGSLTATVQALELSPDRRRAFASLYTQNGGVRLYDLDLATGRKHALGRGFGPALNPARTRLAYVTISSSSGIPFARALVVRDLHTNRERSIPFPPDVVVGTPPELVINWSPDGRRIAVFDGHRIRLVGVATARSVESQPSIPGPAGHPGRTPFLAPAYLNLHELVVDANCCERRQHLAAIDLSSGARSPFATLSSPPQNVWRVGPGTLLVEDALNELVLVSRGRVQVVASRIAAAAA